VEIEHGYNRTKHPYDAFFAVLARQFLKDDCHRTGVEHVGRKNGLLPRPGHGDRHGIPHPLRVPRSNLRTHSVAESSLATLKSAAAILSLTGIGGAYLLASAWFVISIPTLHLLWVIASFFLGFYAISTIKNFGPFHVPIMICVGVPLWDRMSQPKRMSKIRCGSVWHPRLESCYSRD